MADKRPRRRVHLRDRASRFYLSNKWFDLIRYACEMAKEYGLEAWLYLTSTPYPSGMSGWEILLEHPDAGHHKILNHKTVSAKGRQRWCWILDGPNYYLKAKNPRRRQ